MIAKKHLKKRKIYGEKDDSINKSLDCKVEETSPKEYKQRHDNIASIVNLKLWQKFGLVGEVKWYNHKHESMMDISTSKQTMSFDTEGMI